MKARAVDKGPQCTCGVFLANHPEIAPEVEEALAAPTSDVPNSLIRAELVAMGYEDTPGLSAFQRHRRRANGNGCACP